MTIISINCALNVLVLLATIAFIVYKFSIRNFDYWKKRGVPYPKPLPFLGNFLDILTMRTAIGFFLAKLYNEFQTPYFGIYILNKPYLVLRNPELIRHVLIKDFNYFYDRPVLSDDKCDSLFSKMLFAIKNPEWKFVRHRITPVFTSGKIKNMLALVNEVGEEMRAYLKRNVAKDWLEAKEVCAKYTTDVIASCAFGINANSFQYENADFRVTGRKMFDFRWKTAIQQTSYFIAPSLAKFFRMPFLDRSATDFLREVFWATIKEREKTQIKRNDLIDIIIQMKSQPSTDDDIKLEGDTVVAQAAIFFVAGFETTSATMSFTMYELCIHPNIQDKLRSEIKAVVEEYGGLTYEAIQNMKYLHKCICETLRKYPVLPFLDRKCMKDYKIPNSEFVVEKGTPILVPMFGLHYDPQYFPNPEEYDPERFSDENKAEFANFTYLPFGDGPRNCIGERFGLLVSKLGIAHILSDYKLEPSSETPVPLKFTTKSLLLASDIGLPMRLKKIVSDPV